MYLKQLYKQHKGWSLFVVLFIVGQLFINFKRGVVFSPFYHYGMYSERMELHDAVDVARIHVDQKELKPFDYSAQIWDKITLPIYSFKNAQKHDSLSYHDNAKRLLAKLHVNAGEADFTNSSFNFDIWYKGYLENILGRKVETVSYGIYKYPLRQLISEGKQP